MDDFKCLRVFSNGGFIDGEISTRIRKASQGLGRLRARALKQQNIWQSTKLGVHKATVLVNPAAIHIDARLGHPAEDP